MAFGGVHLEYAKGINLPSNEEYKNLKSAKKLAIDIGMFLVFFITIDKLKTSVLKISS